MTQPNEPTINNSRRRFLTVASTCLSGLVVLAGPLVASLPTLFDPLRRRRRQSKNFLPVAPLDALPDDGVPRTFAVLADQKDAWSLTPRQRIGSVYLRREPGNSEVRAFSAICPHAGCFVGFNLDRKVYQCPCHRSSFTINGQVIQPSPSPRDLDPLETRVSDDGQILVDYREFYTGRPEREAKT